MKYNLNEDEINYVASGAKTTGNSSVLIHSAIDLTRSRPWEKTGFTIEKFLDQSHYPEFITSTKKTLIKLWASSGLPVTDSFSPDQFHTLASTKELHLAAVEKTKQLPIPAFPIPIRIVEERISEICGTPLIAQNPFDNQSIFHFRVVRPDSNDNNPLHRDVWLEDYANCINLYIPIIGSNPKSSLAIIPGSHHWPENKTERTTQGAEIDGTRFNVPAVTSIDGTFEIVRPNPKENEVLVFSPYLIHGGAVNLNNDQTRISIELRLWKKP
ncbi:hypothetical protein WSM22_29020 [Cytophagales bacterium WSM2-2]|nr:hypothetical protein WSM22_29020 [Cytophagales bacterium WSM2-2]